MTCKTTFFIAKSDDGNTSRGADGRCSALVRTPIAGVANAKLDSTFVELSGPLSIAYVDIKGPPPEPASPVSPPSLAARVTSAAQVQTLLRIDCYFLGRST